MPISVEDDSELIFTLSDRRQRNDGFVGLKIITGYLVSGNNSIHRTSL